MGRGKILTIAGAILLFAFLSNTKFARAEGEVWLGPVSITSGDSLTVDEIRNRSDCMFQDVFVKKYGQPIDSVLSALTLNNYTLQNIGNKCVIDNSQGYFTNEAYSNDGRYFYELTPPETGTYWLDPAPAGDVVLVGTKISYNNLIYNLSIENQFSDNGGLQSTINNVQWRYQGGAIKFRDKNTNVVNFLEHAYSANGQYLAVRIGAMVALVNLQNLEMTPVGYFSSWSSSAELAASSDGKYVAVKNNGVFVFEATGCERKYPYSQWDITAFSSVASYTGCVKSPSMLDALRDATGANPSYLNFERLYFSDDSSTLLIGVGVRKPDAPPSSSSLSAYDWLEYSLKPDLYVSDAVGYLAMGDSYSSGEGDTQGAIWYEPGTDEQGDKTTFAGRNLCHLSRRSYPYLIAKQLGYLSAPEDVPASPLADSLFHSVACSGAKMHNVTGLIGEKQDDGDAVDFSITDNQYRFNEANLLGLWQPGSSKQLNYLLGSTYNENIVRSDFNPAVITVGIGGNDAGFGSKLASCLGVSTCDYATSQDKRSEVIKELADEKSNLTRTYKKIKQTSPSSRVYALGYPKFVQASPETCGSNVHLDNDEATFVNYTTQYYNLIIQSAAAEAGVGYVNVEDILINTNLCSGASDESITVNGVTVGNDIDFWFCPMPTGCFGSETYHPNHRAQEKYRTAILAQTENLTSTNPSAIPTNVPLPSDYFGPLAQAHVNGLNGVFAPNEVIQETREMVLDAGEWRKANISLSELFPGSEVQVEIHSTPISIGSMVVDSNGIARGTIGVPEEIEPGYHEIHAFGIDKYGEKVHYYESLLIAHSPTDFDGDGASNELDSCKTVPNLLKDVDNDGVDDACDGEAIEPEVETDPIKQFCEGVVSSSTFPGKLNSNGQWKLQNKKFNWTNKNLPTNVVFYCNKYLNSGI